MTDTSTVELATELTIAWLSNPSTRANADEVDAFLTSMYETVGNLTIGSADQPSDETIPTSYTPAVSVRKSLASRDHIISMIDGRPYRTLKRHVSTNGLTPDEYRTRYNLKPDYPMVAPAYSDSRRETAKRLGLGRTPVGTASKPAHAPAEPPAQAKQAAASERKPARKSTASNQATASHARTSAETAPDHV